MAKSGQIQLGDDLSPGDSDLSDSVVFTESTPTNLGGVTADLLDKSDDPLIVVIDIDNRRVMALPDGTDLTTVLLGDGKKLIGTITRDDATKRSSPVTRAAGDSLTGQAPMIALAAAIDAGFATAKPSKSLQSILSAVEDANASLDTPATGITVVVDQNGDGSVKVYAAANLGAKADIATALGDDAVLADLKQIPSSGAAAVTPLAFE